MIRAVKPPVLRDVKRATGELKLLLQTRRIDQLNVAATRLRALVLEWTTQTGQSSLEIQNAKTVLSHACVIRPMPVHDSGPCRYTIPAHAGTRFRSMPVHDSGPCRYTIPAHAGTRFRSMPVHEERVTRTVGRLEKGGKADGTSEVIHEKTERDRPAALRG